MHDERKLALLGADRRRLVRAASRLLGPAEAEDAVQDAYLRALEADTLEFDAAPAWLLTVVRHLAIDQLRRRRWMAQWLAGLDGLDSDNAARSSPSAEWDAALADEVRHALRLLAAHLAPADGAALLLHEVFEAGHAEIAQAGGKSEAASRQQLRRALSRLRQAGGAAAPRPELDAGEEAVFRQYLLALQLRDPQPLRALLSQPPIAAQAAMSAVGAAAMPEPPATACGVVQVGAQLGLVLTLDGVTLCVLPLGVQAENSSMSRVAAGDR